MTVLFWKSEECSSVKRFEQVLGMLVEEEWRDDIEFWRDAGFDELGFSCLFYAQSSDERGAGDDGNWRQSVLTRFVSDEIYNLLETGL